MRVLLRVNVVPLLWWIAALAGVVLVVEVGTLLALWWLT